jgi:hypothetical protein
LPPAAATVGRVARDFAGAKPGQNPGHAQPPRRASLAATRREAVAGSRGRMPLAAEEDGEEAAPPPRPPPSCLTRHPHYIPTMDINPSRTHRWRTGPAVRGRWSTG